MRDEIRSTYFIFNPVAEKGDAEQDLATIRSILESTIHLNVHLTTAEVDAGQLAIFAVQKGTEAIISCGGDGTCFSHYDRTHGKRNSARGDSWVPPSPLQMP